MVQACVLGKAGRRSEAGDLVQAAEARQPGMERKASDSPGVVDCLRPALVLLEQWLQ